MSSSSSKLQGGTRSTAGALLCLFISPRLTQLRCIISIQSSISPPFSSHSSWQSCLRHQLKSASSCAFLWQAGQSSMTRSCFSLIFRYAPPKMWWICVAPYTPQIWHLCFLSRLLSLFIWTYPPRPTSTRVPWPRRPEPERPVRNHARRVPSHSRVRSVPPLPEESMMRCASVPVMSVFS